MGGGAKQNQKISKHVFHLLIIKCFENCKEFRCQGQGNEIKLNAIITYNLNN